MNKTIFVLCFALFAGSQLNAQSWLEKVGNKAKEKAIEKVEERIERKTDEAVDKVLDKTEDAIKKKESKKENTKTPTPENAESNIDNEEKKSDLTQTKSDISYAKYDFVAGNEVIFEDDLKDEQKGEFPSKWDLVEGNAEIAEINGEKVLAIVGFSYITPLFKDKTAKYLPDEFTLEFDFFIDDKEGENAVEFENTDGENIASSLFWKDNTRFLFNWKSSGNEKTSEETFTNSPGWRHYALSFNKCAIKVYVDEKRVANIPNITEKPAKVKFFARGSEDNSAFHIRNIRIAKGAVPLYDKLLTDGKIITHGITFDVGKATIKPQSMGTINEIFSILQKYPDLRFSVEGHTDNTGNTDGNQTLSEARAKAVCDKLQQMGIAATRLTAKGHGMSKPMDSNETAEGRAKNRRVEFVKIK